LSKQQNISHKGKVIKALPDSLFKVDISSSLGAQHVVLAYLSGKLKQNYIQVAVEDFVQVEMSPYDLSKGRIVYRY